MNIGIIGGGQLAQMLALAAYPLGFKTICLDPNTDCPAAQVTEVVCGDYTEQSKLKQLADRVDVITYEFENIHAPTLAALDHPSIHPTLSALTVAQDRLHEKNFFTQLQVPTTQYVAVDSYADLQQAAKQIGLPAVLKTRRWGYDGKGQFVIHSENDLETAWQQLQNQPLILENKVPFVREVSCIAARALTGEIVFYPLIVNQHQHGILRMSQIGGVSPELQQLAMGYVERMMQTLDYVGVLTVEFFQVGDQLIANEMAPRVHNSGHWTIEGADISQFENHLRAITGLPLGSTRTKARVAMLNFIGDVPPLAEILNLPQAHYHLYGKPPRPGRKLGHVTLCSENEADFSKQLLLLEKLIIA